MSTELKSHLRSANTWMRGLFILLFAVFYSIAEVVLWGIVLFQFGSQLITGKTNEKLRDFSRGLNAYLYQLLQFFTYRSEVKPYPFNEWPGEGLESVREQESAAEQRAEEEQQSNLPTEKADETTAGTPEQENPEAQK